MSKTTKNPKAKQTYTMQPWSCIHHPDKSQIEAYIMATGKREVVAEILPAVGAAEKEIAEFIVKAVNAFPKNEHLIDEMKAALEICLTCEGLTWAAEHDASIALRKYSKRE